MTLANLCLLVEMRGEAVLVGVDAGDRRDVASPIPPFPVRYRVSG